MKWLLLLALILVLALLIWFFFGRPIRKDAKAAHRADTDHPATETTSAPVAAAAVPAEASGTESAAQEPAAEVADEAPAAEEAAAEPVVEEPVAEPAAAEPVAEPVAEPAAEPAATEEPTEAAAETDEAPADDVTDADTAAVVAEAESVTAAAAAAETTTEPEPEAAELVATEPEPAPAETPEPEAPAAEATPAATAAPAEDDAAPYAGAVLPAADGSSSDAAYDIKGSSGKKYHTTASPYYGRTKAAVYFNSEESAEAAGFVRASSDFYDRGKKTETAETEQPLPPASSYGAGSADPLEDGSSPHPAYVVKGNIRKDGAKRYHTSASTAYKRTQAEVWFDSEESAEAAGFVIGFKKKATA